MSSSQSAVLDALLTGALGTTVDLSVADHQALASTTIGVDDLLDALNAAGTGIDASTALSASTPLTKVYAAASTAALKAGNSTAKAAVDKLAMQASASVGTKGIVLGDLFTVDSRKEPLALADVNLLDFVTGSASLFNTKNVAAITPLSISGAALGLESVIQNVELSFLIVEPAKFVCGPVNTQFYSANIRLRLRVALTNLGINLPVAGLLNVNLNLLSLDLVAAIGRASGTLKAVDAANAAVTLQATPGIAELYLGVVPNQAFLDRTTPIDPATELMPATIARVDVGVLGINATAAVTARAYALGTTPTAKELKYTGPYPQTLSATTQADFAGNLVRTLLTNLEVAVAVPQPSLGVLDSVLAALSTVVTSTLRGVGGLLGTLLDSVSSKVLDPALTLLGVKLGEVAVTVERPYKVPVGAACNDNAWCTENDVCNASNVCTGTARNCGDSLTCTADSCDEVNDRCVNDRGNNCIIDNQCAAAGASDPSNGCRSCNPAVSTTSYTNRPLGASCDDGQFCTANDVCSGLGTCGGLPRVCSDGLSCTLDRCDEDLDRCVSAVTVGCLVEGLCVAAGVDDPGNSCRTCNPVLSLVGFSNKPGGSPCADGLFCTVGDACNGAGVCASTARDCGDGLACTVDACDEQADRCLSTISSGCVIGNACVPPGAEDPTSPCRACQPGLSAIAYTDKPAGAPCTDGQFCTVSDACNGAGVCTGTARVCDPGGQGCTSVCDESLDQCRVGIPGCLIGGACLAAGTADPTNPCRTCVPELSTSAFSPRPNGTACSDGLFCTTNDRCNEAGVCVGGARDCGDNVACTAEACDEAQDRCTNMVNAGCLIGGLCQPAGPDPSNPCRKCDPAVSITTWTNLTGGTTCSDGLFCTTGDTCNGEGKCVGTQLDCGGGSSCASVCDEAQDRCRADVDGCSIDGVCYAANASPSGSPCKVCDPARSRTSWSLKATSTSCDDGAYCTTGDACTADGACVGAPRSCGGEGACSGSCDEDADRCVAGVEGCTVDGTCVPSGSHPGGNPCQVCDPARTKTEWSPVAVGTSCSDGAFCTENDACTAEGVCRGAPRSCSDRFDCTRDVCDENADRCVSTVNDGCLVDGACYASGAPDPANACRSCNPAVSNVGFTSNPRGVACDDGLFCTTGDNCDGAGHCGGALLGCGGGTGTCASFCEELTDTCVTGVLGCSIAGSCVAAGTEEPGNACRVCNPLVSAMGWTNKPAGTTCSDGLFCTDGDACSAAGVCAGTARTCSDGLDCTTDVCNEQTQACVSTYSGGCVIDGRCVPRGTPGPDGQCRVCDPSRAPTAWSNAAAGVPCEDGQFCTRDDRCDGNGACAGSGTRCADDGLSCTGEMCDEASDSCRAPLTGGCLIAGLCVGSGAASVNDGCMICQPNVSTSAYTYDARASGCDADHDGLRDVAERTPEGGEQDHDGDGLPDHRDPDDDGDTLPTREELADPDGDGMPNDARDLDLDGIPDYLDPDDDNDTRPTAVEIAEGDIYGDDIDRDLILNWYDVESDGDGASDLSENFGDGDSDDNDVPDYVEPETHPDDTDRDGLSDAQECGAGFETCIDSDGDGLTDERDPDDDNDSLLTRYELVLLAPFDTDGDGLPDHLDPDDDDDWLPTREEFTDPNGDGDPSDGRNLDLDGLIDSRDPDDDGDGILTRQEILDGRQWGSDIDLDGIPNWYDTDSDGDGISDSLESRDGGDLNGDRIPDYLQPLDRGDAGVSEIDAGTTPEPRRPTGGVAGGSGCSAHPARPAPGLWMWWLFVVLGGLAWHRNRR